MFRSTFLNPESLWQNFTKKPLTVWHYFTCSTSTTHSLNCKEGIINSQALPLNMIISEDHILPGEFNDCTRSLLAPYSDMGKSFTNTIHKNYHPPIENRATFTTIFWTSHKHDLLTTLAKAPIFIHGGSCSPKSTLIYFLLCIGPRTHMYTWDISTLTHVQ